MSFREEGVGWWKRGWIGLGEESYALREEKGRISWDFE